MNRLARSTLLAAALLAACAAPPERPARPETLFAVTDAGLLVRFAAARPEQLEASLRITGLAAGERIRGIDFRPADGRLYGAGTTGRLYRIDIASGAAVPVGVGNHAAFLQGEEIGFDFNPVVDRIRLVDEHGANLRLHPDTGEVVDANPVTPGVQADGRLRYAMEDPNEGRPARVIGAAYTNAAGAKGTTNYAIDAAQATLVTQGTREGLSPAKPPNTPNSGWLYTVGPLGVNPGGRAGFDIEPTTNAAFAAFTTQGASTLYLVDLRTGAARPLGRIGGEPVRALAVRPLRAPAQGTAAYPGVR